MATKVIKIIKIRSEDIVTLVRLISGNRLGTAKSRTTVYNVSAEVATRFDTIRPTLYANVESKSLRLILRGSLASSTLPYQKPQVSHKTKGYEEMADVFLGFVIGSQRTTGEDASSVEYPGLK